MTRKAGQFVSVRGAEGRATPSRDQAYPLRRRRSSRIEFLLVLNLVQGRARFELPV